MMKHFVYLLAALSSFLLCSPARCDDVKGSISAAARADDARLEGKVSVVGDRVPLGELLERLSAATGVILRVNDRDALSSTPVFVALKDVPLADAMNAVWSLLSYPTAPWRWDAEGIKNHYVYTLTATFAAHQLAARLKAEVQNRFEMHAALMLRIAQMDPEERRNHIKELSGSLLQSGDGTAKAWINDDLTWAGLRTFAESVSPDELAQVLRSQQRVDVPVSKLTVGGKAFLDSYMQRMRPSSTSANGTTTLLLEPETITFLIGNTLGQETIAPTLFVYIHGRGISFMGGSALELGVKDWLGRQWMLPGDTAADALEDRTLTKPANGNEVADLAATGEPLAAKYPTARGLQQLSVAAPLSVLALLSDVQHKSIPRLTYGATAKGYLDQATLFGWLNKKWRAHVLLLGSPLRALHDDMNLPYRLVRNLTTSGVRGTNFMSLAELAEIQATLTKPQLAKASNYYAIMRIVEEYAPLLAIYGADHDIGRTGGMRLDAASVDALRQMMNLPPQHEIMTGQALAIRLTVQDDIMNAVPVRRVHLEYMRSDRKWALLHGFTQIGTASDKPTQ